jgi:O-antigen ligase
MAPGGSRFLWARLTDQLYPDRPLATLRTTQWQFAGSMAQQRPWTGWGLRNFTPL